MRDNKEKGVSLLEPKNRGVYTVNFKHPILKDNRGNNKVITKSLGADIGKDTKKAEYLLSQVKEIINNKECYENYYEFLKAKEIYDEKAINIVFDSTPFINKYYSDKYDDILNKFISFNDNRKENSCHNRRIKDVCLFESSGSGKSLFLRKVINEDLKKDINLSNEVNLFNKVNSSFKINKIFDNGKWSFSLNKYVKKHEVVISYNSLEVVKNKIKDLWSKKQEDFNLEDLKNDNSTFLGYKDFETYMLDMKNYITKKKFEKIYNNIKDMNKNECEVCFEIRDRETGKCFSLEEIFSLSPNNLDRISSLAYIYFSIDRKNKLHKKKEVIDIINEMFLDYFEIQEYCDLYEQEKKAEFNEDMMFIKIHDYIRNNMESILDYEFKAGRIDIDFSLINKEDLTLLDKLNLKIEDSDQININLFNKNSTSSEGEYLSSDEREKIAKATSIIWNLDINKEFVNTYNKEFLKYLIINGYLNKTKFYISEEYGKNEIGYFEEVLYSNLFNNSKPLDEKEIKSKNNIINIEDDLLKLKEGKLATKKYMFKNKRSNFIKEQFSKLLRELEEEEYKISDEILTERSLYYLNTILCNSIFTYESPNDSVSKMTFCVRAFGDDQVYKGRELRNTLLNNIKINDGLSDDDSKMKIELSKLKPLYKYEKLVYLSQEVKKEFMEEFLLNIKSANEETLREFLLRVSNDFKGREYRKLYPEYMLERKLKAKLTSFLLAPESLKGEINFSEFEKIIATLMESLSREIIQGVKRILVSNNIDKWIEISEDLEKSIEKEEKLNSADSNLKFNSKEFLLNSSSLSEMRRVKKKFIIKAKKDVENLIYSTFNDESEICFLVEDKILSLIKNVMFKNSVFKAIKGEVKIF